MRVKGDLDAVSSHNVKAARQLPQALRRVDTVKIALMTLYLLVAIKVKSFHASGKLDLPSVILRAKSADFQRSRVEIQSQHENPNPIPIERDQYRI